jgi:hypothetical protein
MVFRDKILTNWKPLVVVRIDQWRQKTWGDFHDQADAKWIVIWEPLRGHNDTSLRWPTPERPIGCPGVGCPQ